MRNISFLFVALSLCAACASEVQQGEERSPKNLKPNAALQDLAWRCNDNTILVTVTQSNAASPNSPTHNAAIWVVSGVARRPIIMQAPLDCFGASGQYTECKRREPTPRPYATPVRETEKSHQPNPDLGAIHFKYVDGAISQIDAYRGSTIDSMPFASYKPCSVASQ